MLIFNQHFAPSVTAKWEKTEDGFLRCRARVLKEGVMPYRRDELTTPVPQEVLVDPIQMLVTMDSLASAESLRSLEGAAVVVGEHEWVTPDNFRAAAHGHVAGAPRVDGPYLEIDLMVTDPTAMSMIESGVYPEISAAYHATPSWEPGDWDGAHYDARQTQIRYNHLAVIPTGHGRAGADVKIMNVKGDEPMPVKVKLLNTGRFVNTDDEGAAAVDAENEASEKASQSFESAVAQLEEKSATLEQLNGEIEALKGELGVYKEKLDALMSDEAVEAAATEMVAEQGESDEILENEVEDEKERDEIKNSIRTLRGTKLYNAVLKAVGVNTEGMSDEALRGAFKAQNQISKKSKRSSTVSGASMTGRMMAANTSGARRERSALEKLGFKSNT